MTDLVRGLIALTHINVLLLTTSLDTDGQHFSETLAPTQYENEAKLFYGDMHH